MKKLMPWDKDYKKYNRNGLVDFGDRSTMPRKFIEHLHPTNSIMLETLDDQISSYTIYRIIDRPVDVSTFIVQVEKGWGLNPYREIKKKLNLDEKMETVLTMMHNSQSDPMAVNEIIEDFVKELMEKNGVQQISSYFLDHSLNFKKIIFTDMAKLLNEMKAKQQQRVLNQQHRSLFGWGSSFTNILTVLSSIAMLCL